MPQTKEKSPQRYHVPTRLVEPLLLRSRESYVDDGVVYDPIAASACQRCLIAPECLSGDINQKQLLHVTLAQLCDRQVKEFISQHSDAWVINVGAGLDTRFYRVDNGLCHWVELDITENLLWRQKLFHKSERYHHQCGNVDDLSWLDQLPIPDQAPVLILCEHALLDCTEKQVANFIQLLGRHFVNASACLVLAGDLTAKPLGQKMGSGQYAHGFNSPGQAVLRYLPWAQWVKTFSPLDRHCNRWKLWQRLITKVSSYKQRLTPLLVQLRW